MCKINFYKSSWGKKKTSKLIKLSLGILPKFIHWTVYVPQNFQASMKIRGIFNPPLRSLFQAPNTWHAPFWNVKPIWLRLFREENFVASSTKIFQEFGNGRDVKSSGVFQICALFVGITSHQGMDLVTLCGKADQLLPVCFLLKNINRKIDSIREVKVFMSRKVQLRVWGIICFPLGYVLNPEGTSSSLKWKKTIGF